MPLVSFGIAVLVLGGMSTTLAGTITLNSSGNVEFGQGIVTTAACDTSIEVTPATFFDTTTATPEFKINQVTLRGIGIALTDTTNATQVRDGCLGKTFTIKAYNANGLPELFTRSNVTSGFISFKLMADTTTVGIGGGPTDEVSSVATRTGNWSALSTTASSQTGTDNSTNTTGVVVVSGFTASAGVTRFTLETSQ
jgi:hypothetical protein